LEWSALHIIWVVLPPTASTGSGGVELEAAIGHLWCQIGILLGLQQKTFVVKCNELIISIF
jgi:hypothetical protein